ncbi:MAG: protein-L-isoaspartate(D-aspartate) O-methyltransferase [Bacteroidales bacterium]|nr:protein-L-isoaspartate(D-aspartate) O-methyltransferase [Bacteroidales bacterium]
MCALQKTYPLNIKICLLLVLLLHFGCKTRTQPQADEYLPLRNQMVDQQIASRGITDRQVLTAMRKVERHLFVPPELARYAYGDHPLSIGYGQTISQPYIVAFMTQVLNLEKTTKVLEIGTGSGYQAAILGEICDSVFSIEIVPELGVRAARLLKMLGYSNVLVKTGDGYLGWPEHATYDAIIVTCAPTHVPEPLMNQLAEGGRMIIPVGQRGVQDLVLLSKKKGKLVKHSVLPVRFVPMVDDKNKTY